jgi:ribonuclease HI
MNIYEMFTDGGCSGNPGPASVGVIIYCDGKVVCEIAEAIGNTTNNVAEYSALIRGLKELKTLSAEHIRVRTDSELMYYQIKGTYKVKHPNMVPLHKEVLELLKCFKKVEFKAVPREENTEADRLASSVLRKKAGQDSRADEFVIGGESPSSIG